MGIRSVSYTHLDVYKRQDSGRDREKYGPSEVGPEASERSGLSEKSDEKARISGRGKISDL